MLDFAVDLRQGFLAAHGQNRMAKGHENTEQAHQRKQLWHSPQESQGITAEIEMGRQRRWRQVGAGSHEHRDVPQSHRIPTITVVICITSSALLLDYAMALMFCHQ